MGHSPGLEPNSWALKCFHLCPAISNARQLPCSPWGITPLCRPGWKAECGLRRQIRGIRAVCWHSAVWGCGQMTSLCCSFFTQKVGYRTYWGMVRPSVQAPVSRAQNSVRHNQGS